MAVYTRPPAARGKSEVAVFGPNSEGCCIDVVRRLPGCHRPQRWVAPSGGTLRRPVRDRIRSVP